jgi:hypothetical protein
LTSNIFGRGFDSRRLHQIFLLLFTLYRVTIPPSAEHRPVLQALRLPDLGRRNSVRKYIRHSLRTHSWERAVAKVRTLDAAEDPLQAPAKKDGPVIIETV